MGLPDANYSNKYPGITDLENSLPWYIYRVLQNDVKIRWYGAECIRVENIYNFAMADPNVIYMDYDCEQYQLDDNCELLLNIGRFYGLHRPMWINIYATAAQVEEYNPDLYTTWKAVTDQETYTAAELQEQQEFCSGQRLKQSEHTFFSHP